jgi:5'-nucleotidase
MGVKKILPGAPDLILSGINSGANIADDVTYSGTVAGAMEGALLGIRSIALSQGYSYVGEDRVVPYETTEALAPALLKKLVATPLPDGVLLNVNFPNCLPEEVAGTVVTSQGKLVHSLWVDERRDGRGLPYYWLRFGREPVEGKQGTDLHALRNRLVSVTPLQLDLTAHEIRDQLSKALA